jgi:hypothetical protein
VSVLNYLPRDPVRGIFYCSTVITGGIGENVRQPFMKIKLFFKLLIVVMELSLLTFESIPKARSIRSECTVTFVIEINASPVVQRIL